MEKGDIPNGGGETDLFDLIGPIVRRKWILIAAVAIAVVTTSLISVKRSIVKTYELNLTVALQEIYTPAEGGKLIASAGPTQDFRNNLQVLLTDYNSLQEAPLEYTIKTYESSIFLEKWVEIDKYTDALRPEKNSAA